METLSENRDQSTRKTPRSGVGAHPFATSLRKGGRMDQCIMFDGQ